METVEKKVYINRGASGGAVYGLGVIGALVYFLQNASSFETVLWGIAKSLFWPAFLIYEALRLLGA